MTKAVSACKHRGSGPEIHDDGIKSDKDWSVNQSSSLPLTQEFSNGHVSVLFKSLYYYHADYIPSSGDIGLIGLAVMVLSFSSPYLLRSF